MRWLVLYEIVGKEVPIAVAGFLAGRLYEG